MNTYVYSHTALRFSIILAVSFSVTACLSGSGGSDATATMDEGAAGISVSITNPDSAEIDTSDENVNIAGMANSDAVITSVSWENDLGGNGTASGTDEWQISDIPLGLGNNTITVTAVDDAGNSSSDMITVNRESTTPEPVTLSWIAPTERADGSPLSELAGYRIYYGRMSEVYDYEVEVENPGLVTYVIENLAPGEWYFVVAAVDSEGLESDPSNEAYVKIL